MQRIFTAFVSLLLLVSMTASAAHAAPATGNTGLGYHMVLPDGWTDMSAAEIRVYNEFMSEALGSKVEGTELEILAGYRQVAGEGSYPFILMSADQRGKVAPARANRFNERLVENTAALLESKVFHPRGIAGDITDSNFDRDNWVFTITAEPGGMVHRTRYVYTSTGVFVFRAFFDQRSIRQLPAVDDALDSITLHEWLRYEPNLHEAEPAADNTRNIWIIYAMALLVLIGVWLTEFSSDEEDHPL